MSTTTTNLGLTKPVGTENVSLTVINGNYDILDAYAAGSRVWYCTCGTAATTQAKTATATGLTELETGDLFIVTFTNAQTYNGVPTLNINSKGAKNIRRVSGTNAARYEWQAGEMLALVYDGTYFVIADGGIATTTYYGVTKLATGATSTSGSTALTPASLNSLALDMISGAPVYSTTSPYAVGDRVRYQYKTWECVTAIPTKEAWNAAHWKALDPIQTQIDDLSIEAEQYAQAAASSANDAYLSAEAAAASASSASQSADDAGLARTGAENAQTAAEGAQSSAETAQGLAETAQTAAETAQGLAEDAQTAAETAQTAAETAQTAAEAAQTAAEAAQTAAESAQGYAEGAAVQASQSATAASGSATAAANSATEAASYINSLVFATNAEIDALFA